MRILKITFVVMGLGLISCKDDHPILYEYKGVKITRIDDAAESRFYYGDYTRDRDFPKNYIKSSYQGFDGALHGYLVFNEDKSVMIIPGSYTEKIGNSRLFFMRKFKDSRLSNRWIDSVKINKKFTNIIQLSDVIDVEIKNNLKNGSGVKATYAE